MITPGQFWKPRDTKASGSNPPARFLNIQKFRMAKRRGFNEEEEKSNPSSKTAYLSVQNAIIATTTLASIATGYIYLRNRK